MHGPQKTQSSSFATETRAEGAQHNRFDLLSFFFFFFFFFFLAWLGNVPRVRVRKQTFPPYSRGQGMYTIMTGQMTHNWMKVSISNATRKSTCQFGGEG